MSGSQKEFTRALLRFNAHVLGVLLADPRRRRGSSLPR